MWARFRVVVMATGCLATAPDNGPLTTVTLTTGLVFETESANPVEARSRAFVGGNQEDVIGSDGGDVTGRGRTIEH